MNLKKIIIPIFLSTPLLFIDSAYAGIVTIDYVADDYFEYTEEDDFLNNVITRSDTSYQKITPVDFQVKHAIDFIPPDDDPTWDDNKNENEYIESSEGLNVTRTNISTFFHNFLTNNSPFTELLQQSAPQVSLTPLYSIEDSRFIFISEVESDLNTSDVIGNDPNTLQSDSFEQFMFEYSWIYRNDNQSDQYHYLFRSWIRLPTEFTSIMPNSYTTDELEQILIDGNAQWSRFNESLGVKKYGIDGTTKTVVGYAGYGNFSYEVPEPSTLLLLILGLIGFRHKLKR